MQTGLQANPEELIPAAKAALGLQGNHEGYLKSVLAVKDELEAAVKSPGGGQQIQNAMMNAWDKGNKLGTSLQDLINVLLDSGVKIDTADMDNAARINHATSFGQDGVNSVAGDVSGFGHDQAGNYTGKVNVNW